MSEQVVNIYSDGACRGNPGPGGWGALLRFGDDEKEVCGGSHNVTNNMMELSAVIHALRVLTTPCKVNVYTDSQYVKNGITGWIKDWKLRGWTTSAKKPVKNVDLWKALDAEVAKHQVQFHWVRGHNGHIENERADALANRGLELALKPM